MAKNRSAPSHARASRAVLRTVRWLVRRAHRCLSRATSPFGEALHKTRTSLKRARALLRLIPEGKKVRDRLGLVSRRLGELRDVGIAVVTFDRVVRAAKLRMTPALQHVRNQLVDRRNELQAAPRTGAVIARAIRTLKREGGHLKRGGVSRPGWSAIVRGYRTSYRAARQAQRVAYREMTDVAFHDWRKAVKRLTYQIDEADWAPAHKKRVRLQDLDDLGETLGEAQDLAMFAAVISGDRFRIGDDARDLQRLLARLERRRWLLRKRVRPLAETVFEERPQAFLRRLTSD